MTENVPVKIDYPHQTSGWGKILIDALNTHFVKVQEQIQTINSNFDDKFDKLQKGLEEIKNTADTALALAESNKRDITDIRNHFNITCERLETENKLLKQKTNNLENYSRRNNIIIRGIPESNNETSLECEEKARMFLVNELKLDGERARNMKFVRVHRMGGFQNNRNNADARSRPIIIRFQNYEDKAMAWSARNKISDRSLFISENFSAETEFRRKKLYIIYKYAKSLVKYQKKISLNGDVLIIDNVRYTVDNLHELPDDLAPRQFCEKSNGKHLVFGGMMSELTPFSNWYPCDMNYDNYVFNNLEQAYQYCKAVHCDDRASALKLRYTPDPRAAKELGSKVSGLNGTEWEKTKANIMLELVKIKFSDPVLKAELLKTGNSKLVEAGTDRFYATGLPFTSKDIHTPNKWTGKNKLGNILCDVRKIIKS